MIGAEATVMQLLLLAGIVLGTVVATGVLAAEPGHTNIPAGAGFQNHVSGAFGGSTFLSRPCTAAAGLQSIGPIHRAAAARKDGVSRESRIGIRRSLTGYSTHARQGGRPSDFSLKTARRSQQTTFATQSAKGRHSLLV
jgi:hypothetical protein